MHLRDVVVERHLALILYDPGLLDGHSFTIRVIVSSPDAPRTTSAPSVELEIDRRALSETRFCLETSQPVPCSMRSAFQQSLDQAKSTLPRSPGVHPGSSSTNIALLSRLAIPKRRLCIVLRNAPTIFVRKPELELRPGNTLLSCLAIPRCRLRIVLGHVIA